MDKVIKDINKRLDPPYFYNLQPYGLTEDEVKEIILRFVDNSFKVSIINCGVNDTISKIETGYVEVANNDGNIIYYEEFPECKWNSYKIKYGLEVSKPLGNGGYDWYEEWVLSTREFIKGER